MAHMVVEDMDMLLLHHTHQLMEVSSMETLMDKASRDMDTEVMGMDNQILMAVLLNMDMEVMVMDNNQQQVLQAEAMEWEQQALTHLLQAEATTMDINQALILQATPATTGMTQLLQLILAQLARLRILLLDTSTTTATHLQLQLQDMIMERTRLLRHHQLLLLRRRRLPLLSKLRRR